MATTEKLKEVRDWANLGLTLLTVLIIPCGLLILRNQRLEIREEMRQQYVTKEIAAADHNYLVAENVKLSTDVAEIKVTLGQIQIQIARLADATKLNKDRP